MAPKAKRATATDLFPGTYDDDNLVVVGNNGISFDQSRNLVNFNGTLFFSGESTSSTTGDTGYELFKSDGTAAENALVKDIRPNNVSPLLSLFPDFLHSHKTGRFSLQRMTACTAMNSGRLTAPLLERALVKDISLGAGSSYPFHLINANHNAPLPPTTVYTVVNCGKVMARPPECW